MNASAALRAPASSKTRMEQPIDGVALEESVEGRRDSGHPTVQPDTAGERTAPEAAEEGVPAVVPRRQPR
ncbi:hypothetical protein Pmar_PMAR018707, partial [Perkinsus marinus ATCC 50983]